MSERGSRVASLLGATLGRYEVKALIGRGAQGTVYLARDVVLNRSVALKVLLGSLAQDKEVVQAFHREAQTAAGLRHPGIVRVYSAGAQDGIPYISMEYVAGEPLDRFIKRHDRVGWVSALYIGSQVADALDCAHRHGVVHRDVKPGNILLDREGRAHLTDFGIANVATGAVAQGGFAGTLHYTSPEQCAGGPVGAASDLYSLGVTLYRLISGQLPFDADSPVILMKKISTEAAPRLSKLVPDVPDDVSRLVAHLLEKQPRARPADARTVVQRIERIQSEDGGRSVIAEALAAYVKEQAASPRTPTPTPCAAGAKGARRGRRAGAVKHLGRLLRPRTVAAVAAILVVCVAALAAGVRVFGALESTPAPLILEAAAFDEPEPGALLVHLPYEGYECERIRWVGDRPVLLVQAVGREGTLTHGAAGVFAVDVEGKRCWSVVAPTGPAMDDTFWSRRAPLGGLHPIVAAEGAPLAESLLLPLREEGNGARSASVALFAQRWNERLPRGRVLLEMPAASWDASSALPTEHEGDGAYAVPSPDGRRMCLVLYDGVHQSHYLVERHVAQDGGKQTATPLTTMENSLIPGSVQYAPDGRRVGYMRRGDDGTSELWVVRVDGAEVNGTLIARGAFEEEYAFSPDGARILVTERIPETGSAELRLLSALDGARLARLGPGRIGSDSWSPSGEWVAALAGEPLGDVKQLWLVDAAGVGNRRAVTNLQGGVQTPGAVSPGGRWVAALVKTGRFDGLIVVDLNGTPSDEAGVHMAKVEEDG